jgi:hypothetical protein
VSELGYTNELLGRFVAGFVRALVELRDGADDLAEAVDDPAAVEVVR